MQQSNSFTPAEAERLALLIKAMGKALQLVGEVQQHGYDSSNPYSGDTATYRQMLQEQLGDVRHAMIRLCDAGDLSKASIHDWAGIKAVSAVPWLHHQEDAEHKS